MTNEPGFDHIFECPVRLSEGLQSNRHRTPLRRSQNSSLFRLIIHNKIPKSTFWFSWTPFLIGRTDVREWFDCRWKSSNQDRKPAILGWAYVGLPQYCQFSKSVMRFPYNIKTASNIGNGLYRATAISSRKTSRIFKSDNLTRSAHKVSKNLSAMHTETLELLTHKIIGY